MSAAAHTWRGRLNEASESVALARQAAGSWTAIAHKVRNALPTFGARRRRELRQRLQRLQRLGYLERLPTRLQCAVGAVDMMRFFLVPSSFEDQKRHRHSLAFSCLLRFLDDPSAMVDPIGLRSSEQTIIAHLLHVVHAYPLYDLQLLDSFEGGLDELERQLIELTHGTHPRQAAIEAVMDDPDYPQRLLGQIRRHREGRSETVNEFEHSASSYRDAGQTFGSFAGTMRYCGGLPKSLPGALRHLARVRSWDAAAPYRKA